MLEVKPKVIPLGTITLGQTKEFTLEVINHSDVAKHFDLKPSCGSCTTVYLESRTIKANETITADVVFKPESTGTFSKTITLQEEGINREKVVFTAAVEKL